MGVTAKTIVNYAISQIGTKENPAGSNKVKYNTWYYGKEVSGNAYPWCAVFTNYVFHKCNADKLFCGGNKSAYCPTIENYYKSINRYYSNKKGKVGDLCIMDFGKGRASHIGIVEKKNADGTYTVIEGNTSTSSNDNGGCVMRRIRSTSVIRGFCRPKYSSSTTTTAKETTKKTSKPTIANPTLKNGSSNIQVKYLQQDLNYILGTKLATDCIFGANTASALKQFQKKYGLVVDGIYGKKSYAKMKKLLS